jgi:hypothetical protein
MRGWWSGNLSSRSVKYDEYSFANILFNIARQEQVAQTTNTLLIVKDGLFDGGVGDELSFLLDELGSSDGVKDGSGGISIPFNKDAFNL